MSQWSDCLKTFQQRIGKYFARIEARQAAFDSIQALLGPVERKNGWQLSEQVGYANPSRLQHLLSRAQWDVEGMGAEVRDYAVEHLDDGAAILATEAMAEAITIPSFLVFRVCDALVLLAQNSSSFGSLLSLP